MKKKKRVSKKLSPKKIALKPFLSISPLADRVLVKEVESQGEKKTDSGIYIPDSGKEERGAKRGAVVAVGLGRYEDGKLIPSQVVRGDTILYSWGEHLVYEGEDYVLVREGDILAIIN